MSGKCTKLFCNIVATCIIATIQTIFLVYKHSESTNLQKIEIKNVIALFQKNYKYSDEVPRVY